MKLNKIYLINRYDKWCPENNNGDHIVAAFSSKTKAEEAVKLLDSKDETIGHTIHELIVDPLPASYS